ncbi:GntR family transcriptional regulator [Limosilactobacillus mucosae]
MAEIKYEIIRKTIQKEIESGKYQVGDKLPTESNLMETFGVSRYTVRRAISELQNAHYVYRIQGGGMYVDDWQDSHQPPKANNKMIGLVTTHLVDYIFPNIISGIDRIVSAHGYSLIVSNTHNQRENERRSLERLLDTQIAGLIVEPTQSALANTNMDLYQKIAQSHLPMVFINAHYPQLQAPYLEIKDKKAEYEMTRYLIKQGHKRILGIFQVDDLQGTRRMEGFINAYMEYPNISYLSETVMYQSGQDMNRIFQRVTQIMERPDHPTAIVCYNDALAIQVMDVVSSAGLKIPEDVSIVGFDDYVLGRYFSPRLTTIEHPKEKMGLDAGRMIMSMIDGEVVKPIEYDAKLIFNDSVRKLK